MIVHLLESTLLLAIAILIAHVPRLAARTRYAIVFAALMKFAIPSAVIPRILATLGIDLAGMKGTIAITAMGPLSMMSNLPRSAALIWPTAVVAMWALIAVALLGRSFVRGRAAVRVALANAFAADEGDVAALAHARDRAGVTNAVRVVRSTSITTPATIGLLRPIIVIPANTELAAAELETILTHECAHVARRDNLLSVVESIAGSALWFHPLVWIARRVLDGAREEACDAVVVSSGDAGTYVHALGKVCVAMVAPRAAGISCIVSNTIQERMNNIMRFGTRRLLPHRTTTTAVIALIAVVTIGSGVAKALPQTAKADTAAHYEVRASLARDAASNFVFNITVRNRESGKITTSHFQVVPNEPFTRTFTAVDNNGVEQETVVRAIGRDDGTATVNVDIKGEAPILIRIVPKTATAKTPSSDEPISLDLKNADIRDVLLTFAKLTNTDIVADPEISGKVTASLHDVPWTEALDKDSRRWESAAGAHWQHDLRPPEVGC
jgi:beta-lactamase regulating signal transducer with metallopeptidase domain